MTKLSRVSESFNFKGGKADSDSVRASDLHNFENARKATSMVTYLKAHSRTYLVSDSDGVNLINWARIYKYMCKESIGMCRRE